MFCPIGYVPASVAVVVFNEWMEHLFRKSIAHGDPLGLKELESIEISRICTNRLHWEFVTFLSNCESLNICGLNGVALHIDSNKFLNGAEDCWSADWFPDELKHNDLRFFFVDTERYVISIEHWNTIFSTLWQEKVHEDWLYLQYEAETISQFEGWALCISEEDERHISAYITERYRLPVELLEEQSDENKAGGKRGQMGRPPMLKAKAAYAKMNFDRGELSREQLARRLESLTGEKPSPRTTRDWEGKAANLSPRDK
jgi:hypothetical protein